ncbi:MAG: hypothetical protein BHW36_00715 [Firmicutes bacterium CAG:24053_14]|nr:MAG: hypothetical protein BHW36_00715 [Firmicutes bacterium CAG:24053_14]
MHTDFTAIVVKQPPLFFCNFCFPSHAALRNDIDAEIIFGIRRESDLPSKSLGVRILCVCVNTLPLHLDGVVVYCTFLRSEITHRVRNDSRQRRFLTVLVITEYQRVNLKTCGSVKAVRPSQIQAAVQRRFPRQRTTAQVDASDDTLGDSLQPREQCAAELQKKSQAFVCDTADAAHPLPTSSPNANINLCARLLHKTGANQIHNVVGTCVHCLGKNRKVIPTDKTTYSEGI